MADFSALVNELKKNNSEEATRDSRRLAQATAHNQDQNMRFEMLGKTLGGKSDDTKKALDGVAEATKGSQLTPTQQKEKDQQQQSLFSKLGDKFSNMSNSFTDFFKKFGARMKESGLGLLKNFAIGLFIIGVLKFLQSDMFSTLLDKAQEMFKYFDDFGASVKAFIENPSFGTLVDMFGESGPILLALGGLFVLLNPLTTLSFLTKGITKFVGMFTKGGLISNVFSGKDGVNTKLGKKGIFSKITSGANSLVNNVERFGRRLNTRGKLFNRALKRGAKSPFATLRRGMDALFNGVNSVGRNLTNAAKSGGRGAEKGLKGLFKGGGKLIGGLGKAAMGALRFAGPAGLVASAGMAIFDGVSAGVDEFKKGGSVGDVIREGFSGAVSGLTFGFVSQETISEGLTSIGEKTSAGFKAAKDAIGGIVGPDAQWAKDLTASTQAAIGNLKESAGKLLDKLPSFDEVQNKVGEMAGNLAKGFEDITGITLPKSLDEAGAKLTDSLSSLGDTLGDKFSSLKEGVGGFFSSIFGGEDENAKASIESDVVKLKEKEIDTLSEKIVDAEARFERIKKILEGGVNNREKRELRALGIEAPTFGSGAKENANEEVAMLREQIANMNKQLEQAQSGGTTVTNVNAPDMSSSSSSSTVAPIYIDNASVPAGVGAGT